VDWNSVAHMTISEVSRVVLFVVRFAATQFTVAKLLDRIPPPESLDSAPLMFGKVGLCRFRNNASFKNTRFRLSPGGEPFADSLSLV